MKMIEQAANNGWLVNDDLKRKALESIEKVFDDEKSSNRERVSATRALVAIETLNLKHEKKRRAESDRNRFLEAAERLGIGHAVAKLSQDDSGASDLIIDGTAVERTGEGCPEETDSEKRSSTDIDSASSELESPGELPG